MFPVFPSFDLTVASFLFRICMRKQCADEGVGLYVFREQTNDALRCEHLRARQKITVQCCASYQYFSHDKSYRFPSTGRNLGWVNTMAVHSYISCVGVIPLST